MMKKYYVNRNKQSNGDHEVHHSDCPYLLTAENRNYLGEFYTCDAAVREAKKRMRNQTAANPALRPAILLSA